MTTNDTVDLFTTLQERLEEARKEKGVTVSEARKEIQRRTGLSRATMTHWWNGTSKEPRGADAALVADYFGVNPLWLAAGKGPKRAAGKGVKTMPIPKGTNLDEDKIASMMRVGSQMSDRAFDTWIHQGQGLVELTKRASPTNPYGKKTATKISAKVKGVKKVRIIKLHRDDEDTEKKPRRAP